MKPLLTMGTAILTLAVGIFAQNPTSAPSAATARSAALQVELTHSLDARKARVGDLLIARCLEDFQVTRDIRIPKNAKLIGHLTAVQRKARGQGESTLGIAFDRAQMRDGRIVPLTAVIEAITRPAASLEESDSDQAAFGAGGGSAAGLQRKPGVIGNLNSTATAKVQSQNSSATALPAELGTTKSVGNLTAKDGAREVVGISGLELDASPSASANGSVIRSSSQNVRLESGTRLSLRVALQ
ncbi:MAG: hypothetical protein ACM3JB_06365 [Acidobacteriaceae bacterium]